MWIIIHVEYGIFLVKTYSSFKNYFFIFYFLDAMCDLQDLSSPNQELNSGLLQ